MANEPIHTCPWSDRCYACYPLTRDEVLWNARVGGLGLLVVLAVMFLG